VVVGAQCLLHDQEFVGREGAVRAKQVKPSWQCRYRKVKPGWTSKIKVKLDLHLKMHST
jgi:hypothetical protein